MVDVLRAEERHLVVDAMVQPFALFVKVKVVLLQLGMAITFHVPLVIRQADAKSVKVQESVCAQIRISLDTHQGQTLFMELMVE